MGNARQRRIEIAIVLVTLALCALFLAQGVTALLAGAIFELDPSVAAPAAVRAGRAGAAAGRSDTVDPTQILQRNIFDSQTGDLTAQPVIASADPEEPVVLDPNAPPPPCDGPVRLVASLVNARYPEWSFASIAGPDGKAMLYRAGMSIEGREIMGIGSSQVFLRPSGGNLCTLAMFSAGDPAAPARPAVAAAAPAVVERPGAEEGEEGGISTAEMEQGIQRQSDTQYTVARGLVDQLLENQAELMRTARIIPHQEGGRTVGVKLYGIRRNSLLGRLGLQNGDMLRTINGYDMTSPDSALEAYSRLRGADNLTVAVVRRGQAMTIDYNIQ